MNATDNFFFNNNYKKLCCIKTLCTGNNIKTSGAQLRKLEIEVRTLSIFTNVCKRSLYSAKNNISFGCSTVIVMPQVYGMGSDTWIVSGWGEVKNIARC